MATTPTFSYRNAVVLPPQRNVSIYVDIPPPMKNARFNDDLKLRTLSEDYILRCFSTSMFLSGVNIPKSDWNDYLMNTSYEVALGTFVYEDKTLREMASPENSSYKKLETTLRWIGDKLNCNVSVFVGHIETCSYYVDTIYQKTIKDLKVYSSLPTIFLIIACRGNELAFILNTDSRYSVFRDHKVAFFGFEDLLHIHEGEIYSTKLFDTARSKAICDSEDTEKLLDSFPEALTAVGINIDTTAIEISPQFILKMYRQHPELEIFKCCRAKLGRLYSDFVKGLERRETTKYTKELLAEKFAEFARNPKSSVLTKNYTTITSADGMDCSKTNCNIPNLYEAEELLSQEFNKKDSFRNFFRELKSLLDPDYTYPTNGYSTQEDFYKRTEQFFKRIQGLKGREMSIFTYTPNLENISPILYDLIIMPTFRLTDYSKFKMVRFVLQKYGSALDLTIQNSYTGITFLHAIASSSGFTEEEQYTLFKTIYDILPKETRESIFFLKDKDGNISFAKGDTFQPLLCLFYIDKFGSKVKDVRYVIHGRIGNLLHALLENEIVDVSTERSDLLLQCAQGLLNSGVDPNEKLLEEKVFFKGYGASKTLEPTLKPLELHTQLYLPPYNTTLFTYFLRYGMTNDTLFFSKQKDLYIGLQKQSTKLDSFIKVIAAVQEYLYESAHDFQRNHPDPYLNDPYLQGNYQNQAGGIRRRYNNNNYTNYSNNDRYENSRTPDFTLEERKVYDEKINFIAIYSRHRKDYIENVNTFLARYPTIVPQTVTLFTYALDARKGLKKHGSKVRRTYKFNKRNLNKTIKNTFTTINFTMNGEKMIGDLIGKIMDLSKRKEFTKEEKVNYKQRPLKIQKSELLPREKYNSLKDLLNQMQDVLKTR